MLLNNTIIGNRTNFKEEVLSEGFDVLLLIYSTDRITDL